MKHSLRIALPLVALIALVGWSQSMVRLSVTPASAITIEGTSTVHDWTCAAPDITGALATAPTLTDVKTATVTVDATAIDCDNGTMNRKAADALAVKKHPAITFSLDRATLVDAPEGQVFELNTKGSLTLAGVTRVVETTVKGERLAGDKVRYTGRVPLAMSNFGIDAPTAMLGTLKTGDKVTVAFEIIAAR